MEIGICRKEQPFEIVVDAEGTAHENHAESDTGLDEELMRIAVDSDSSSPSCSKEPGSSGSLLDVSGVIIIYIKILIIIKNSNFGFEILN